MPSLSSSCGAPVTLTVLLKLTDMVTTLPAFRTVTCPVVSAVTEVMAACALISRCGVAEPSEASISELAEPAEPKLRLSDARTVPPLLFTSSTPLA